MPLESPDLTEFTTTSPLILSYSFTDYITGQGYITFYAGAYHVPVDSLFLSQKVQQTAAKEFAYVASSDTNHTSTYEKEFLLPQIIEGDCTAIVGFGSSNCASDKDVTLTLTIFHYDGTTATQLGTESAIIISNSSGARIFNIPLIRKHFTKGDILRIEINITDEAGTHTTGSSVSFHGQDPENEAGTFLPAGSTIASFDIPFIIT